MAIGATLPPRHVPFVRHGGRTIGSVFARQTRVLRAGVLRVVSVTRVLWTRLVSGAKHLLNLRARARQRLHARFNSFEKQYDRLVDLLCAAANEGVHGDREAYYQRLRSWMMAHYPGIHKHLRVHLSGSSSDNHDPFLALYIHPRLSDAINGDTGIEDIMRSREALEAYRSEIGFPS